MIARQKPPIAGDAISDIVAEDELSAGGHLSGADEMGHDAIESNLSQTHNHPEIGEGGDLLIEKRSAVGDLLGQRFVAGRGAADDGGDPGVEEAQAVATGAGSGLRGKPGAMEQGIEKSAGAVAGKGTTGAIGAVRARRQSDKEHACRRVAE